MNRITWYQKPEVQVSRIQVETSWLKALLTVILVLVFISLGLWQFSRAQEKVQTREQVLARAQLPPVTVGAEPLDVEEMVFRYAVATGRYLKDHEILLDNKVHQGQAGYHVLTPLLLSNSEVLLVVNRGWVPWGPDRRQLPRINTPEHELTVRGRLSIPAVHPFSFDTDAVGMGIDSVWQNLDLDRFEKVVDQPVYKLVMQLEQSSNEDKALTRDWPQYEDKWIQRHHGYAVQWFGLALILVLIFIFTSVKRMPE